LHVSPFLPLPYRAFLGSEARFEIGEAPAVLTPAQAGTIRACLADFLTLFDGGLVHVFGRAQ